VELSQAVQTIGEMFGLGVREVHRVIYLPFSSQLNLATEWTGCLRFAFLVFFTLVITLRCGRQGFSSPMGPLRRSANQVNSPSRFQVLAYGSTALSSLEHIAFRAAPCPALKPPTKLSIRQKQFDKWIG